MRFPQLFALLFVSSFGLTTIQAQIQPNPPLAEMRGAWVASVANIDWPSAPGLSPDRQRAEFDSILSVLKGMGINAVFVQIRPAGDAMYPTTLAPWSRYLTGAQGMPPNPQYDPLEYMVKAAHARRMEFHAWLNPYRATVDLDTAKLAPTHPLRAMPNDRKKQWFFKYGPRYYFNPANPLVIKYLNNVVRDIVTRYDVDGIHFDDYFYPYPDSQAGALDDYDQFANDPRGFSNIQDWRRDNVNRLIESTSKTIKELKPWVRFGVSPFGVWRNADKDPQNGSATRAGMTCYDDLYADVLTWLQKGWIDYVAPQIYWSIGFPQADYRTLVDWWTKHSYGKQVYIGHATYKIGEGVSRYNDPNWDRYDQTRQQIMLNRNTPGVQGSIFFSTRRLLENRLGVQDTLTYSLYKNPALLPPTASSGSKPPIAPQFCRVKGNADSVIMAWNACEVLSGDEMPYYFAIYRFNGDRSTNFRFDDPKNLLAITPYGEEEEKWVFGDQKLEIGEYYTYVVLAYNRSHIASVPSDPIMIKKTKKGIKRKRKVWGYLFK
jgi:uncharacterized lipoprotein YddW (UPF0748 family)